MLASERAYQYVKNLKQTDPTMYNTMKSNLDEAVIRIGRRYMDVFSTLEAAPFMGEQRHELSTLFLKNERKTVS